MGSLNKLNGEAKYRGDGQLSKGLVVQKFTIGYLMKKSKYRTFKLHRSHTACENRKGLTELKNKTNVGKSERVC